MLKFLPDHVRSACSRSAPPIRLPLHEVVDGSIVAVIDISGFTQLSTRLFREHGIDGAAKLHEAINRPFERIIRCVCTRSGSIVKFAGDSAVVCWSDAAADGARRQSLLLQSFLCCLELLQLFNFRSIKDASIVSGDDDVGIHIGVGYGRVNHIYLGESGQQHVNQAGEQTGHGRIEYLIAGEAVSEAGAMLAVGNRGEVVLSAIFKKALSDAVPHLSGVSLALLSDIHSLLQSFGSVTITDTNNCAKRIVASVAALCDRSHGDETPTKVELDDSRALRFIESSIARYIVESSNSKGLERLSTGTRSASQWALPSRRLENDLYSDLRAVAVAFFGFPGISLGGLPTGPMAGSTSKPHAPSPIIAAQLAAETVIASVSEYGGSLRQVNFDDKSFTALAVWGLRGFAHHRSEALYAIQACIDFAERIRRALLEHPSVDMGVVNVGVALGTVYAGLIGNELRMDGTVLGATVNLAARLMCAEMSAGENRSGFADVRVCCDEATFRACHAEFEFDTSRPKLLLKGFSDSVSYYPLIRSKEGQPKNSTRSAGQELFGREAEMELLDQSVKRWRDGELNQRVMVTGRSGLGKSALVEHIIQKVEDDSNTISWVCAAHEMRQKSSFAFLGSMLRSLILRLMAKDISPSRFSSARRASRASLGDSSIGTYDSQSLGQSDSEDSVSLFVLETVRLVGKGSIGALGAVPGFRWVKNIPVTSNDVSLTLSSFFAQLLHLIHDLGYSLHIVCDDAQWIDRESLRVLQKVVFLCPAVFFVIAGRTREEWSTVDDFDILHSLCSTKLQLEPLSPAAMRLLIEKELRDFNVTKALFEEVMMHSGGVPMALHVVLSLVKFHYGEQPQPKSSEGTERARARKRLSLAELDVNSAITVQLDSLSAEFRQAVSIASVIGQYFNLCTLTEVINLLKKTRGVKRTTVSETRRLLEIEDRFGFVTSKSDAEENFSFSHYLVHRGVFSALLPQRREVIRRVLVHHLINRFREETDDGVLLPAIIDHLTQLEGETQLKSEYLFKGFISAAKARKSADAFYYRAMLDEINEGYCTDLPLTMRLRDCQLRASLHYQTKDTDKFLEATAELFRISGATFSVPSKGIGRLVALLWQHFRILKQVQASSPRKARDICALHLTQTFPLAFPGKPALGRKRSKSVHPYANLDMLCHALTLGEGLERLDTICIVVDRLHYSSVLGRIPGKDFLYLSMMLLFLAYLGEPSESEKTKWSWWLKEIFLGLGVVFYSAGMVKRANKCFQAANFDPGPAISLREIEHQSRCCIFASLVNIFKNDTVQPRDVFLHRDALDYLKTAGAEFDAISKSTWISFMTFLIALGTFSPGTEQDGVFKIESLLLSMEKCCVDSHFIRKIQCFAAYEAVLRSEFPTAESFIRMCAKDGLSRTTLGFEESNKPAVSHILACVLSLALRLAEQGKLESETTELIQRFGLELVSHLKMSPTPLAVITLFGNLIILVALLGHGLSLSEQVSLDQNQRGQVKEVALAITAAVRGYAWRASRKIFFRLCCIALADVTRLVYGGRCKQAESALSALMRRRDSRMPEHICLMLEARLLRLRRLNDGKDSVAAHVHNLLKRFESFDNRCDPDRLRILFQVDG